MSSAERLLAEAYECYRRGDLARADQLGRRLLPQFPNNGALAALLGMVALRSGRLEIAISHLRDALRHEPTSLPLRTNLAFALANVGHLDEARKLADGFEVPELQRIVAFVDQQQGRFNAAIAGYRRVLAAFPQDYESWNNLGLLLSASGEIDEAIEAFGHALVLDQDPAFYINLSRALATGERHQERQQLLRRAARQIVDNVPMLVELGLAEGASGDFPAAEAAYVQSLAIDARYPPAYLEYGMLLESLNRIDDMGLLVARGRAEGLDGPELAFVEAWLCKRQGRFLEALALAEVAGEGINPSRHAQLVGEAADRAGYTDRAFAAFEQMNRMSAQGPAVAYARARNFPAKVADLIGRLTPGQIRLWQPIELVACPASPIFILGFPRSGTTLLDTLLMNLPELDVLEETAIVERVEDMVGGVGALAMLTNLDANRFRRSYFDILGELRPLSEASNRPEAIHRIVDKHPLHLVRAPLIHRLFPDARLVFVERHPCDVVLSCFMSRFQTNQATVQFHELASAARLYDLAMEAWERAADLLPLRIHRVRYERIVSDARGEMRALLEFLDLPWREAVLDNYTSAARRTHIATASYAQVTEPIYTRATGRWQRYRKYMEPVLPILEPWVKRMGYTLEDQEP